MKKLLGIIVLGLLLCTSAFAKSGKGEIDLSKRTMENFLDYIFGGGVNLNANTGGGTGNKGQKASPQLFTTNSSGTASYWNYCMYGDRCAESDPYKAILRCQKTNGTCYTFAKRKRIVWKNNKNPRGLNLSKELKHGRDHVAQVIKDAGYYSGDLTLLSGFQGMSTNKKVSKITKKKNENTSDIASQLEQLSKLYKSGTLTKDEFNKAKKKLLN